MPNQVLQELFKKYSVIIKQMPDEFTSHDFILRLARQYQKLYVEALYEYRNSPNSNNPMPFQIVHGQLSSNLHNCSEVFHIGEEKNSKDIFGNSNSCAKWKKHNL